MSLSKFAFLAMAMFLKIVTSSAQCTASFTLPADSCTGQTMLITNTSPVNIDSSSWYWSGTNTGSARYQGKQNDTSTFNNAGLTHICLAIDSGIGACRDTVCHNVTINQTPAAPSFTYTSSVCSGYPVSFSVTAPVSGATYSWSFGGTGTTASHTFNSTGGSTTSFPVTLTVTKGGCSMSSTQAIIINQGPDATLSFTDTITFNQQLTFYKCVSAGATSSNFNFTNTSTNITGNTYTINWGDTAANFVSSSYWTTISHVYSKGIHTLTYTVANGNGCSKTTTYKVFVGSNPAGGIASPGSTDICGPASLVFVLSNFQNNASGTLYTITFNDGSVPIVYSQPPPDSVLHLFTISSCGTISSNGSTSFNNSYSASLVVSNPCGITAGAVVPIYVSLPPVASFRVSPSDTVCLNSLVTLTNTSSNGKIASNNSCDSSSPILWNITPSSGWTTSGSLGLNNGFIGTNYDPTSWIPGSSPLSVSFTTPGLYKVQIIVGNGCGEDSVYKEICVIGPPTPQFSVSTTPGCGPLTITPNNTSVIPIGCSSTTTNWIISKTPSPCPGDSILDYRFISGTSAQSTTPTIRFNNSGTYSLNLDLTNVCGTFPATAQTITVKAKPIASIPASSPICSGHTASFNATTQTCGGIISGYSWSFANGNPATSTLSNPTISFANSGIDNISLSVTNECGTSVAASSISILNAPIANTGPDVHFCTGNSAQLGTASTNGLTYSWSPTTGLSSSMISNPTVSLTNITGSPVIYSYIVTVINAANCSSKDTVLVTVNPLPTVTVNSPTTCYGTAVVLTANGANTYSWSPSAGLSATTGTTVNVTNPTANTLYTITGTITATGCMNTATANVSVNPLPVMSTVPNIQVCNQPIATQLTGSPAGGSWSGTGITISGSFTPSGTGSFTEYYSYTDGNSCTNRDSTVISVINPTNANAGTGFSICVNASSHTLTGYSPTGGIWSGSGITGNTFTPAGLNGLYILTYSFGSGTCLSSDTIHVTVNLQPTVSVNSPTTCFGVPVALTASGTSNTYSWSPSAGLSTTTGVTVNVTNPTVNTSYTVNGVITATGCTNTATANVSVNSLPVMSTVPNIQVCNQPIATQLSGSPAGGSWSGTGITTSGSFTPSGNGSFTEYYIYTDGNNCTNRDSTVISVINPTNANAGTGFSICVNASPYTLTGYSPAGGTWSGSGITGNTFNPAGLNGLYILTYSFGSGTCLSSDTIHVTVNLQPTVSVNSPTTCFGVPVALTASGTSNTYSWSPSAGLSTTTGVTVNVTNPTVNTTYTVTGTITATGCTNTATANVSVNSLPVMSTVPNIQVCNQPIATQLSGSPAGGSWSGTGITTSGSFTPSGNGSFTEYYIYTDGNNCTNRDSTVISVINPTNANAGTGFSICVNASPYTLTGYSPTGGIWSGSGITGNTFNPAGLNGPYILTYSYGSGTCLSSDTIHVTVNPLPVVSVNSPTTCSGVQVALTASGTSNTYSWSPAAGLSATTGTTVNVTNPTANTSYTVTGTITATGCTNTATANVIVNPLPVMSTVPNIQVCNQPIATQLTGSPAGGSWSGTGITISGSFTPSGIGSFTEYYTYTDGNSCTNRDSTVISVINPTNANAGTGFGICVNASPYTLTGYSPLGGTWSGTGISGNTFNPAGLNGPYVLTYSFGSGTCLSSDTIHVTVNPQPTVSVISTPACFLDSATLTASSSAASTYAWSPNTYLSSTTGNPVKAGGPAGSTTYTVTATITATGCTNTASAAASIKPLPVVNPGSNISLCDQPIPDTLTGYSPALSGATGTGAWSGSGVTARGIFTPSTIGTFELTYTFTDTNTCVNKDSITVSVVTPQTANAGTGFSICVNASPHTLTGYSPAGGTWSGTGISGNTFNPAGLNGPYILTYSYGSGTCLSSDTIHVTVNPMPVISVNSPTTCSGTAVALTANGATTYSWSPSAGLSATTGTTVNVTNPTINTSYTVTGTITATGCMNMATANVSVIPLPTVNQPANNIVCNGLATMAVSFTGTGTSYTWTNNAASIGLAASGIGNIASFTAVNNGTSPVVATVTVTPQYTVGGVNCTGPPQTFTITVNPTPTINQPSNQVICSGSPTTAINFAGTGTSYSWTNNMASIGLAASGTGNIASFTAINATSSPVVATIMVTPTALTCIGPAQSFSITVNPSPTVLFSIPPQIICSGTSTTQVNLTSSTVGASISWTANVPPGILGASTSGTTFIAAQNLTNTTFLPLTITYTAQAVTTGVTCPGMTSTYTITVNPLPDLSVTPKFDTICSGTQINIQLSSSVNGVVFTWSANSPPNITGQSGGTGNSITQTLTNSSTTPQTVIYSITTSASNCPGQAGSASITVNPSPTVQFFLPDQTICSGLMTRAVQITSPTAGAVITWTAIVPAFVTGAVTSGTTTIPVQVLTNSATTPQQVLYTASVNFSACPGPASNYTITVDPLPQVINTDTLQTICSGGLSTAINLLSDIAGTTFSWTGTGGPNLSGFQTSGNTSTIPAQAIFNSSNISGTVVYTVIPSMSGCDGPPKKFKIAVNPRPIITLIPDSQAICTNRLSAPITITSNTGATTFDWTSVSTSVSGAIPSGTGNIIRSQILQDTSLTADTGLVVFTIVPTATGCPGQSIQSLIRVIPTPIVNFAMSTNSGCSPMLVSFATNVLTFGNPDSLIFNWGDGTPGTVLHPNLIQPIWSTISHTFNNTSPYAVTFTITLTAKNRCGDTTASQIVTVQPNTINAFFSSSATSGCDPLNVSFRDFSTGATFGSWCFNYDRANDSCRGASQVVAPGTTVTNTFNAGTYIVALYITNGCSQDTAFQTIHVDPSPVADFIYNNNDCSNTPVSFIEQSTAPPGSFLTSFIWQFGAGNSLSGDTVVHSYDSAAVYTVCLKATASTGCTNTQCHPVTIVTKPKVNFSGYDTCVNTQPIQFINNSTGATFYNWSFGDGNTSILPNPSNNFTTPGTFTVTLIGSTTLCHDTISHRFIVYPKPTAAFTLPATYICGVLAQISMTNTSSGAQGYFWNFGNNTFSTAINPIASYPSAGNFTVTLIASNQFNCHDSTQNPITIYPFPVVKSITIDPFEGCQPMAISVSANVANGNLFFWNFGDGTSTISTTVPTVNYTYPDTGTYSISLTAYSSLTCGDTVVLSDTVKVHITPIANFEYISDSAGFPFGSVIFTNQSQYATHYQWTFGDGFNSADTNPIHIYQNVDSFAVTLIAANTYCKDTTSKTLLAFKKALYVPNALAPDFGGFDTLVKIWKPIGIGLRGYHAQVFEKWGKQLWESSLLTETRPAEGWDGTYLGVPCVQDVYVWKVDAVFMDGEIWPGMTYRKDEGGGTKRIGSITLIR